MHPEERSQQCYGYCHLAFQFLNSKRIWKLTPSRIFSCKSFFNQLIDDYALLNFHMIWNTKVPNKVQPFAWLLALGKLSTGDVIQRWNLNVCLSHSWSVVCKRNGENADHLFLHSHQAAQLWHQPASISSVMPTSRNSLLSEFIHAFRKGEKARVLWKCSVLALFQVIWFERKKVFWRSRNTSSFWGKEYNY